MSCGRIRKVIKSGYNVLVDGELENLKAGTLKLKKGETYSIDTNEMEYAIVLINGESEIKINNESYLLGPRKNPFEDMPYGAMITKNQKIIIKAIEDSYFGIGSAPAKKTKENTVITPNEVGGGERGKDNWKRSVRFVCWSDNTEGNMLMAGETLTPSGNWSTIPPHRHDIYEKDTEVPYEETYFFQFSKPQGYGLLYQFGEDMDQAFSLKANDIVYMDKGYHPTVCGPGSDLYHLTFIAGPYRISKSRVHKDYEFLLKEHNMENPYKNQKSR